MVPAREAPKMQYDTANFARVYPSTMSNTNVTQREDVTDVATAVAENFSDYINPNNPVSHSNSGRRDCTAVHAFVFLSLSLSLALNLLSSFIQPSSRCPSASVWHTNSRDACVVSRAHMAHFSTWISKLERAPDRHRLPFHFRRDQCAFKRADFPMSLLNDDA